MNDGAVGVSVKLMKAAINWRKYIMYGLLAVVLVQSVALVVQRNTVLSERVTVANQNTQITTLKLERDTAKANESNCRLNLTDQNRKIDEVGKEFERHKAEMKELEAKIARGDFYREAEEVRKQPTPTSCAEALEFMRSNIL